MKTCALNRTGKFRPGNTHAMVEVEVLHEGEEIFGFEEGLWDTIELKYLLGSLPLKNTNRFLECGGDHVSSLGHPPELKGKRLPEYDKV